jgi:hypothetical protein
VLGRAATSGGNTGLLAEKLQLPRERGPLGRLLRLELPPEIFEARADVFNLSRECRGKLMKRFAIAAAAYDRKLKAKGKFDRGVEILGDLDCDGPGRII